MTNDTDETGFPEKEVQDVTRLANSYGNGVETLEPQASAILAKHLSSDLQRLSSVIGASANEVAHNTNVIREAIEKFDVSARHHVNHLSGALYAFRDSMDKSSRQMWWLTFWLVVLTAFLAVFTAVLVFKDVGFFSGTAKTTGSSVKPAGLHQLNH